MHELSLAGGILQMVQDAAAREQFTQVSQLRLEAGRFSGVEVHALRFALQALAPGTCLAGAEIQIDEPAGRAWCPRCAASVNIETRHDPCPQCGGLQLQTSGGTELRVLDLLVRD